MILSLAWILTNVSERHSAYRNRAVCFIGVWEHSVMCWFYPKKGIKLTLYYSTCWNDEHTSRWGLQSHTDTFTHRHDWDMIVIASRFSTLEHGTRWFSMTYIDHSIFSNLSFCVFALLFLVHICMALGRSEALLVSINILFKNKRSTVYNTFHNHTWFLHKMFQNKLSSLLRPSSSSSSPQIPQPPSPGGDCLRPACWRHSSQQVALEVLLFEGNSWVGERVAEDGRQMART